MRKNISETKTENIFRDFYGSTTFIEKSAIPAEYGFKSKKGTDYKGYPDFFKDLENYTIIVEAKAVAHNNAMEEVLFYMLNNNISDKRIEMYFFTFLLLFKICNFYNKKRPLSKTTSSNPAVCIYE